MKLKQWLYGAAALAMLAACSDKNFDPDSGGGENNGNGEIANGYIAVEIKLPEEAISRAGDNPNGSGNDFFDDGLPEEYSVKNAMIVVFKGKSEKSATFEKAVDLVKPFFTNTPEDDQITSSYVAAIPVKKLTDGNHYYGLVFLNRDGTNTNVATGSDGTDTGVKIGGNTLSNTTTFANVLEYIVDDSQQFITANGFFMANAPLSDKPVSAASSAADIHYLADLGDVTYETIAEAKQNVSTCIYVERAVAKVTSGVANNAYDLLEFVDKNGNKITGLNIKATVKYALTNTNKRSYVVRNVEETKLGNHFSWSLASDLTNRFRMIGFTNMPGLNSPFHSGTGTPSVEWYRTYWCHDPNYDRNMYMEEPKEGLTPENTTGDEMNLVTSENDFKALSVPLYCKENTFDVAHQNNGNSTMVVFQVDFSVVKPASGEGANDAVPYDNLYIKDGNASKIYVSKEDACWDEITRIITNKDIQEGLTRALTASGATNFSDANGVVTNAEQYLNIEIVENTECLLEFKSITIKDGSGINEAGKKAFIEYVGNADGSVVGKDAEGKDIKPQIQKDLLSQVNLLSDITEYKGGISYYSIPVKHFGDYYCPWPTTALGTTTVEAYNGNNPFGADDAHAKNYLGRYGMVRNNWYDVKISQIKTLGDPNIPEIDLTLSDDNRENKRYIGVEIHVLSWAKRTQSASF